MTKILYIPNGEYLKLIAHPPTMKEDEYRLFDDKYYGLGWPVTTIWEYSIYGNTIFYSSIDTFLKFVCSPIGGLNKFKEVNNISKLELSIEEFEIIYD